MILDEVDVFLKKVFRNLEKSGINVSDFDLDHVCYRVKTMERYDETKKELEKVGDLLLENEIGGRLIAKYKLRRPILFRDKKIFLIELPQPKGEKAEGWEHVEFVVNEDLEDFMSKYPNVEFDITGLDKKINSDIALNFGDCAVKFHRQSLEYVVKNFERKNFEN